MAKGNPYWGKQRGKLGETVLAVVKGQQTQRAYNSVPANPRSDAQMLQRIKFAALVDFYKRGQKSFFKFAFEDKKQTESDFNAFMRENLATGVSIYPTKEEINDPNFPLVSYMVMTHGTLPELNCNVSNLIAETNIIIPDDEATNWDGVLASNPDLQNGDIITALCILTDAKFDDNTGEATAGTRVPMWKVSQIIIGAPLGGKTIGEYLVHNGFTFDEMTEDALCINASDFAYPDADAMGVTFIHSRKTSTGLRVSTSKLTLNTEAAQLFEYLSDDGVRALPTWKASGEAVLEGAVAQDLGGVYDYHADITTQGTITNRVSSVVKNILPQVKAGFHLLYLKFTTGGQEIEEQTAVYRGTSKIVRVFISQSNYIDLDIILLAQSLQLNVAEGQTLEYQNLEVKIDGKSIYPNA